MCIPLSNYFILSVNDLTLDPLCNTQLSVKAILSLEKQTTIPSNKWNFSWEKHIWCFLYQFPLCSSYIKFSTEHNLYKWEELLSRRKMFPSMHLAEWELGGTNLQPFKSQWISLWRQIIVIRFSRFWFCKELASSSSFILIPYLSFQKHFRLIIEKTSYSPWQSWKWIPSHYS